MDAFQPNPADLVYALPSIVERLDLDAIFPSSQPLEVELGSGDGSFLLSYAQRHPDRNFLGVERLLGRIRKLDRKGRRLGLRNLRGVRIECTYFLRYLLPPHSVQALHVYFPDPWPKKKHRKNRLINEAFPELAKQALQSGGRVHVRTDDRDYFEEIEQIFAAVTGFEPEPTPPALASVLTDFERDYLAENRPTHRASYRRVVSGR